MVLAGNDSQQILGAGPKGELKAVITVHTQRVQAFGQLQIAKHFGHDAIRAVAPTRNLGDCLVLAEVAGGSALILVPVDHAVHLDRGDAPAIPGVRIGLVEVGEVIVIVIPLIRVDVKTGQLFLCTGNGIAMNGVWSLGLRGADLRHVGDEAGRGLVDRCGGKAGRQSFVIHIHRELQVLAVAVAG